MKFLTGILSQLAEYQQLEKAISEHQLPAMATGLSAIHKSHLIHTLCAGTGQKALVIAGDEAEGARLCSDISAMGTKAVFYPARDFTFREVTGVSREFEHQRIGALYAFSSGEAQVMICCADAAMQYTMPKDVLMKSTLEIKEGASLSMEAIMESLLAEGYVRVEQVDGTGQFAARGGILDFFMPSAPQPCRIEFWGDEIDTISSFDIETQRRTDRVDSFVITPSSEIIFHDAAALAEKILAKARSLRGKAAAKAKELLQKEAETLLGGGRLGSADKFYSLIYETPADVFDYITKDTLVFVSEQTKINDRIKSTQWQ